MPVYRQTVEELWPFINDEKYEGKRIRKYVNLEIHEHYPTGDGWPGKQKVAEWVKATGDLYYNGPYFTERVKYVHIFIGVSKKGTFYFRDYFRKENRDSQRKKCYNAEQAMRKIIQEEHYDPAEFVPKKIELLRSSDNTYLDSLQACKRFMHGVIRSPLFKTLFPKVHIQRLLQTPIYHHGKGKSAWYNRIRGFHFARWAFHKVVVLHELAHAIVDDEFDWKIANHGPEFCHVFLILVKHFVGEREAGILEQQFIERGVKYHLPEKSE